jgi:hypothetical protein
LNLDWDKKGRKKKKTGLNEWGVGENAHDSHW